MVGFGSIFCFGLAAGVVSSVESPSRSLWAEETGAQRLAANASVADVLEDDDAQRKGILWHFVFDVLVTAAYTVVVVKGQEQSIHALTTGIALASMLPMLASGIIAEDTSAWDWFSWAKRFSLLAGWLGYLLVWAAAANKGKWPGWVCTAAPRFLQVILMLNVAEAGALMTLSGNYTAGIPCLLLACFALDWSHMDERGRVGCEPSASILGCAMPCFTLSARWYCRCYYVLLSFCLCLHPRFANFWVFVYFSCLWPLFYQEVIDPALDAGIVFKVRAFMLICTGTLLDTFVDAGALELSTFSSHVVVKTVDQNVISALCIVFSALLFFSADKCRAARVGSDGWPLSMQEPKE